MAMQIGKDVKLEKAERALTKADALAKGESVWFFGKCNNFKPTIDSLVITNARIMGLSHMQGFKYMALIAQVTAVEYDQKKRTVSVTTSDGQVMTFKAIPSEDVPTVEYYLEYARQHPAPDGIIDAITQRGVAGTSVLPGEGGSPEEFKALKKAQERHLKDEEAQRRTSEKAAQEAMAGRLVETGVFGGKTLRIYQNGYVRVSGLLASKGSYEKLISIEASSDVSKKSGLGRGAGAVMTMGLNLASSNKRGDVYLTIVTNHTTHVLHEEPPTERNLKTTKKLEAAGTAAIQTAESGASDIAASEAETTSTVSAVGAGAGNDSMGASGGATLSERLRELTSMRDDGLVSAEEFESLRAKLLESL